MLTIKLPEREGFDERTGRFVKTAPAVTLKLEHSLKSVARWESKWNTSFLSSTNMTHEQSIDYIRCMSVYGDDIKPEVFENLTNEDLKKINDYIDAPMTATKISHLGPKKPPSREIITAEVIYWWMIQAGIPFDPCEKWHLKRLLTLIEVCSVKSGPQKKMGRKEQMAQQRALNEARRAKLHTRG